MNGKGTNTKQANSSKPVRIIRAEHDSKYFAVSRQTAQDQRLSWEARGLLIYLLSKPDDWEVQPKDLEQGCGHGKVYKLLKELRDACYLRLTASRNDKQRITGYFYEVYEIPYASIRSEKNPFAEKLLTENGQTVIKGKKKLFAEKLKAEKLLTENRHITYNRDIQSTEKKSGSAVDGQREIGVDPAFQERGLYYNAFEMGFPAEARVKVRDTEKNQRTAQFLYANGYQPIEVIELVSEKIASGKNDYRFDYLEQDMASKRLESIKRAPKAPPEVINGNARPVALETNWLREVSNE